ncbi:MAG: hypothetical protein LBK06_03145 [Planctomycetaceae bacterium]|nr:hypothetical protein [Planctomycetaceae bacterium]
MKRLFEGEAYCLTGYGIIPHWTTSLYEQLQHTQPLFIQFPLVAYKATQRALMPLFFRSTSKI